jgi:hypothetical protein
MEEKITASHIKKALANIHTNDFFATECKNGPTYNPAPGGLLIFDAIAIAKSWARPQITVYEVKVSRSDFLRDGKYQCYLPYCNEFYFVVPKGLIKKEELPTEVGLKYYYPETGAIKTVKKAIYRYVEINAMMMFYIIMNKIDSDRIPFYSSKAEYAAAYIESQQQQYEIGKEFGTKLTKEVDQLKKQLSRTSAAAKELELLDKIIIVLESHGIHRWWGSDLPQQLDKKLNQKYPRELDTLEKRLAGILDEVKDMKSSYQKEEE